MKGADPGMKKKKAEPIASPTYRPRMPLLAPIHHAVAGIKYPTTAAR